MRDKFLANINPIGQHMIVHYSFGDTDCEIVGVVGDARTNQLRRPLPPRFYMPFAGAEAKPVAAVFLMRVAGDPRSITDSVRRILHDTNAAFAPPRFRTIPELIDLGLSQDRLTAELSGMFGALAIILAAVGLYGVLSYSVSRRVSELGVRMALGAQRGSIVSLVLREALVIAFVGSAIGVAAAVGATRVLGTLLFNISPRDPMTIVGSLALLTIVAVVAAAVPASRASRTDPIKALRAE